MGGQRISPQIIAYFRERPNRVLALDVIARALRLEQKQTQKAIHRLASSVQPADGILAVVQRGKSWKWIPTEVTANNADIIKDDGIKVEVQHPPIVPGQEFDGSFHITGSLVGIDQRFKGTVVQITGPGFSNRPYLLTEM